MQISCIARGGAYFNEPFLQLQVGAVSQNLLHPCSGGTVECAAAHQDNRSGFVRMRGGIAQSQHRAPGMPHERWGRSWTVRTELPYLRIRIGTHDPDRTSVSRSMRR
jgi:hypothetical protein